MIAQIIFAVILAVAVWLFSRNVKIIRRNILLGREVNRYDRRGERWKNMFRVALGQGKMGKRPVAAVLHLFVYAGFVIINIEVLEILIDGVAGTHRIFAAPLGGFYNFLIGAFEWLALGVLVSCVLFLIRRNLLRVKRFSGVEMTSWPRSDANYILIAEILLMIAFLTMNAADLRLQQMGSEHYTRAGAFPVSALIAPVLPGSESSLAGIERAAWWFHILGILAFLNYIPYSKHFHIFLAFPNTFYANLDARGRFSNMPSVTREVKAMLDPSYKPDAEAPAERFGARDVRDLSWAQLMNAYACTECGRCTAVCPANLTGKLLSPRKIMMDTRDRLEEVGAQVNGRDQQHDDGKALLGDYISAEELWACTTCNACVEACPVDIDPLSIIVDLRRYLVMEESSSPASLNAMFTNVENNGAPWQFSQADRLKWAEKS